MTLRRIVTSVMLCSLFAAAAATASAYCLTGLRWPNAVRPADVLYNSNGRPSTGQCITSAQLDTAVLAGISPWVAIEYAGTTTAKPNKLDNKNVVGWARLGAQTLGITNYLRYGRFATTECDQSVLVDAIEVDVRLSTSHRWTSTQGSCPCAAGSAFYLNAVSEHEFGHLIGLCHVGNASSLMYASVAPCENKSKGSDETQGEGALCY